MSVQWPLLIFSVLTGTASGMLVFMGIGEVKDKFRDVRFLLSLVALVLLAAGGCASVLHLGHVDRAFYILGNMASGLSKELITMGFVGIVTLAYVVLARKGSAGVLKVFGILCLIGGVALPLVAGASYMMPARPAWDSVALPLMYLGTGIGLGFMLSTILVVLKGSREDASFALKLGLAGVCCMAATMAVYVAWIGIAPHGDESRSIMRLITGDLAMTFWAGFVLIGIVGSLAATMAARKKLSDAETPWGELAGRGAGYLGAALACMLAGNVALRMIMYAVATSVERLIY